MEQRLRRSFVDAAREMVGDYPQIRTSPHPAVQAQQADLERRLAGTGIDRL